MKRQNVLNLWVALVIPLATAVQAPPASRPPQIPLREGLTIVTAVNNGTADFESIKRITHVGADSINVTYSAEAAAYDNNITQHVRVTRTVRKSDLATAHDYQWDFHIGASEIYPGCTAFGVSASVLQELNTKGQTDLRVPLGGAQANMLSGVLTRVERGAVPFKVIVNDEPVELAAVHARGRLGNAATEFWILDDAANPLALRWAIGDRRLQTIKLSYTVSQTATAARIERDLEKQGRTVVYGIYFDYASDRIKEESNALLAEIARVLTQNPAWSLAVEGHTDNIGGGPYNLDLSRRRAEAVKQALVTQYHVDRKRLQTNGYGASRPKDTNDTLQGRAQNRRVELVKVG